MRSFLFLLAVGAVALLPACSNDKPAEKAGPASGAMSTAKSGAPAEFTSPAAYRRLRHRIDSLEAKVTEAIRSPQKAPDVRLTMYLIQAHQYFAHDFPKDSRAPESLDRAGQLYGGVLGDNERAVEYYEQAYRLYPQYKNRPQVLLQQGVAYEAMQDTAGASLAYRRLILTYPDNPLAEQAKGLLRLVRMSKAERDQFFGQRPAADAAARK